MQPAIIARHGSADPEIIDVPLPREPGPGEILCRTLELGICGTDREILHSKQPALPPGSDYLILGHECLGRIEAVGTNVTDWQVGDLVVPAVRRPMPNARRRLDLLPLGEFTERGIWSEHGFSSRLWLDEPQHLYRVSPEIADIAIFAEPLAVAEKGVNEAILLQQARLGPEVWQASPPRVLVTGMGPIGFAAVLASVVRGFPTSMLGRDRPDSFRAQLARQFGANYFQHVEEIFDPADIERTGFDLVLECTGSDEMTLASAACLRSCGVQVWYGSTRVPEPARLNFAEVMRNALLANHLFLGTVNAAPRDFQHSLAHLRQLKQTFAEPLAALLTARVRLEESLWHYAQRQPQGIKTVIEFPGD